MPSITFTTGTSSWPVPHRLIPGTLRVQVTAPGGGGGGGDNITTGGGAGGGGGEYAEEPGTSPAPGVNATITIPVPGTAGPAGTAGGTAGNATFTCAGVATVTAHGGGGGATNSTPGGTGGTGSGNTIHHDGGAGGTGGGGIGMSGGGGGGGGEDIGTGSAGGAGGAGQCILTWQEFPLTAPAAPRRIPARAYIRFRPVTTVTVTPPVTTAAPVQGPPRPRTPAPRRGTWRGVTGQAFTAVPAPRQGPRPAPRRTPGRAYVRFRPVTTTNQAPAAPVNGTVQPLAAQPAPRRRPARAYIRFRPVTTTNAAPVPPAGTGGTSQGPDDYRRLIRRRELRILSMRL